VPSPVSLHAPFDVGVIVARPISTPLMMGRAFRESPTSTPRHEAREHHQFVAHLIRLHGP
jgi:hypothetical protein